MDVYNVNPELSEGDKEKIESELGLSSKKVHAKFLLTGPMNAQLSAERGRRVHTDVVSIIEIPEGVRDYIARPATEEDKRRYPVQWQKFNEHLANPKFPIEHLAGAKPSEIAMFHAAEVFTIQAAAALTNPQPELVDAVLRAKRWLAIASGEKPRIKLEAVA